MYTIFTLVCISKSSKAFELAATYLQVKKGTKEQVIIKTEQIIIKKLRNEPCIKGWLKKPSLAFSGPVLFTTRDFCAVMTNWEGGARQL